MICHVDGAGQFTAEVAEVVGKEAGEELVGKEVLKAGGKAVVDLLRVMGGGVLLAVEKIKHRYPYDWKTGEPVIVTWVFFLFFFARGRRLMLLSAVYRATSQWFANLDGIKEDAQHALKDVNFMPEICSFYPLPFAILSLPSSNPHSAKPSRIIRSVPFRMVHLATARLGCPHPRVTPRPYRPRPP